MTNKKQKNNNNTNSESIKKFKPVPQNENIFIKYLRLNKHIKSFKFWLYNALTIFLFAKVIQLYFFAREFSYAIPKEQLRTNMFTLSSAKGMNPEILHEYLDKLEKTKEERKNKYLK
jgi:hypothetical protein